MKFLLLLVFVVLSGCSTTTVSSLTAIPVKPDSLFSNQTKDDMHNATLVVTRDSGFIGSGCSLTFFINGERAAKIDPGETAKFYVQSGSVIMGVGVEGRALCGVNPYPKRERETVIRQNETKWFRLFTDQDVNLDVLPTSLH